MKHIYLLLVAVVAWGLAGCEKPLKEYDEPTGMIAGKVVDKTTQRGLKDIFVVFEKIENGALHGTMSKTDGSFSFGALSTGEYKIYGIQDTLRVAGDTLRMKVNNGQKVVLNEELLMETAGVPQPEVPEVVAKTHSSVTLRVPYQSNGSMIAGYGFFYTAKDQDPTMSDTRKGASTYYDIIRKNYYEVVITGLKANTNYRFKAYLYVKNWTPLSSSAGTYIALSDVLSVTTDPMPVN